MVYLAETFCAIHRSSWYKRTHRWVRAYWCTTQLTNSVSLSAGGWTPVKNTRKPRNHWKSKWPNPWGADCVCAKTKYSEPNPYLRCANKAIQLERHILPTHFSHSRVWWNTVSRAHKSSGPKGWGNRTYNKHKETAWQGLDRLRTIQSLTRSQKSSIQWCQLASGSMSSQGTSHHWSRSEGSQFAREDRLGATERTYRSVCTLAARPTKTRRTTPPQFRSCDRATT